MCTANANFRIRSELLERVLEHTIGTGTVACGLDERQWVSAGDIMQAQPYRLVPKR